MTTTKSKTGAVLLCLCITLILCGLGIGIASIAPKVAYAQGNTDISTFSGTESFSHKYLKNIFTKGEDYNENLYTNTGIRFRIA